MHKKDSGAEKMPFISEPVALAAVVGGFQSMRSGDLGVGGRMMWRWCVRGRYRG